MRQQTLRLLCLLQHCQLKKQHWRPAKTGTFLMVCAMSTCVVRLGLLLVDFFVGRASVGRDAQRKVGGFVDLADRDGRF